MDQPSEALALIRGGPMVAPPQVPAWVLPSGWEPMALEPGAADCEDDAYESLELLGANPGVEQVIRAWVSASRLVRNLWQLSRATEGRRLRW